jgi:phosphatidate cytidylyltransferase
LGTGIPVIKFIVALPVLVPAWGALNALHLSDQQGPALVLFLVVLMWIADSGAYFAGRSLGRHKLAPSISPGKTWEGVFGGLVACAVYALIAGNWFSLGNLQLSLFIMLALVTAAISVAGDLFISLLKRQEGIKDSGNLIPGHGGILDRIDSLLAAAPVFLFGYGLLGL